MNKPIQSEISRSGLEGQHSIALSILLHLLPGALIVAAFVFIGIPASTAAGYPTLFGFFIACLLVLVPWELGIMLYLGKKKDGRLSLSGVLGNTCRTSFPMLILFVFLLFTWAFLVVVFLGSLDTYLRESAFSWVPVWFDMTGFSPIKYSPELFSFVTLVNLLFFGIALPLIEELYFRGYLLPRMRSFGKAAPFANSMLFCLYHMWTPWQAVTRFLFVAPMVWLVWRRRSIDIGIWTHCFANSFGIVLTYITLMSGL